MYTGCLYGFEELDKLIVNPPIDERGEAQVGLGVGEG